MLGLPKDYLSFSKLDINFTKDVSLNELRLIKFNAYT